MEHRMSLRVRTRHRVTITPSVGHSLVGELRDLSFDGALLVPTNKAPEALLQRHVRILVSNGPDSSTPPIEFAGLIVRAKDDGVGVAFDPYDAAGNAYLERTYAEGLEHAPESV